MYWCGPDGTGYAEASSQSDRGDAAASAVHGSGAGWAWRQAV